LKKLEHGLLTAALWIAGPVIAYLALPIEGEFWVSLMPTGNHWRAYALCLGLDIVGELFIYFFSRIQQTERKGSKRFRASWGILAFSGVTVVASWGVAFQQLLRIADMQLIVAALNALIQPATQLGVGYTQAVLEGKFDGQNSQQVAQVESESEPEPRQSAQKPPTRRATRADWRAIYPSLNGDRAGLDADRVNEILAERGFAPRPTSTARDWAREAQAAAEAHE